MSASEPAEASRVARHLLRRRRWRPLEIVAWAAALALISLVPSRALLINEILILGLFALSLDLALGFAGLVSLGHAAFLGLGAYTAGIMASRGLADPALGLVAREHRRRPRRAGHRAAGAARNRSDAADGDARRVADARRTRQPQFLADRRRRRPRLRDRPVLGQFPIDFTGRRAAALYSFAVVFVLFALARRVTRSNFGLSVQAIRQNRLRAGALGIATNRRLVAMYGLAAAYAGAAGALLAQTTQIVSLDIFDFHRSADVLLMLIIGGPGYLYGGLIGAAMFIGLRTRSPARRRNIGNSGSACCWSRW